MPTRHGGAALVEQLATLGVEWVFGVPGESFLATLDALHGRRSPRFVTCRHEGGAGLMAEAAAKLTGRLQVCMVSRGPGATNASLAVHVARQDSTPLLLIVGQVPRAELGRESFQEIDVPALFAPVAKWATTVTDPDRIPEVVAHAAGVALGGRPGPVVLAVPEDVSAAPTDAPCVEALPPVRPSVNTADMDRAMGLLATAERPMLVIGGTTWSATGCADLAAVATEHDVPVAAAFRQQDLLDNDHPCYVGTLGTALDPRLAARVRESDVVVAVGTRLDAITTSGHTLLGRPGQRLVHVHPSAEAIGAVVRPTFGLVATADSFAAAARRARGPTTARDGSWRAAARADYESWSTPVRAADPAAGTADLTSVMADLRELLPADAIVTNGAGNYTGWLQRYLRHHVPRSQLAPVVGTMGYGVPAAIAGGLLAPDRLSVAFAGDGCFLMTGQELATAAQERVALIVVVVDNGRLATIRMHQQKRYPGRVVGTDLASPDFAALCAAYGGWGTTVSDDDAFPEAWTAAVRESAAGRPALIRLVVDPERLSVMSEPRA